MIRNPKDFGVWSACPSGVHSLITKLEMLSFKSIHGLIFHAIGCAIYG